MQPQQFNIEGYYITDNEITVTTERYSIVIPVIIPMDKFEWWLRVNDRLKWELTGSEKTINGTMSLQEYWATDPHYIKQDIYAYIISNPITREGVVYSDSVQSLLLAFDLHNTQRISPVFNTRWEFEQEIFEQVLN